MQPGARSQNPGYSVPACDLNMLAVDSANSSSDFDNSYKNSCREQYSRSCDSKKKNHSKRYTKYDTSKKELIFKLEKLRKTCGNRNTDEINYLVEKLHNLKKPNCNLKAHSLQDNLVDGFDLTIEKLNIFVDSLSVLSDQISSETVKIVSQIVTAIFNIMQCPTWKSFTINLTNLLIQYVPKDTVDYIIEYAKQLFGILVAHGDDDKEEPFFKQMFGTIDRFVNNELWEKMNEFVLKIVAVVTTSVNLVSFDINDFGSIKEAFKSFRTLIPDMKDIIDMIYGSYQFIITHWDNLISGDWGKLPLYKDEVKEFESEVRQIEAAYPYALKQDTEFLKTMYKMDLKTFEKRLDKAVKTSQKIASRCTSQTQKLAIGNYVKRLYSFQSQWYSAKKDNPSKPQPYGIKVSGPSSCGKSTITEMIAKIIAQAYDLDPNEPGLVAIANLSEKFESTILPNHKIIACDDVANSKVSRPDYDKLLNYINTMPRPLTKAGVDEKGEFYPNNIACMVTTNVEDLGVLEFSNCGESILRRFKLHIHIKIRPEFRNEYGGLIELDGMRYDIYEITLKRFSSISKENGVEWDIIPRREWIGDEDIVDQDFQYLMRFIARDARTHRIAQQQKYDQLRKDTTTKFCNCCSVPTTLCLCDKELEAHIGGTIYNYSSDKLLSLRQSLEGSPSAIKYCITQKWLWYTLYNERKSFCQYTLPFWFSILSLICTGFNFVRLGLIISFLLCFGLYQNIKMRINQEIDRRCNLLSSVTYDVKQHFQNNSRKYFAFSSSLIALYGVYQMINIYRKSEEPESQDVSTYLNSAHVAFTSEDTSIKDKKGDARDYVEGLNRARPKIHKMSATTTSDRLINTLTKSLRVVVIKDSKSDTISSVNGMMIEGNVLMIPAHAIPLSGVFDVETTAQPNEPCAKSKDQKITDDMYVIDEENDVAYIVLPSAPPGKNLINYFPLTKSEARGFATTLVHKQHDGHMLFSKQAMRPNTSAINYSSSQKTGFFRISNKKYHLENNMCGELQFNSLPGLCGSPYIDIEIAIIYGFHVAGYSSGRRDGFGNMLTQDIIRKSVDKLKAKSPFLVTHSEGVVRVDNYGLPYTLEQDTPLYERPDGLQEKSVVTYLGKVKRDNCELLSNARSPYMKTKFKGVSEQFGPSKFKPPTNPNAIEKSMKTINKLLIQYNIMNVTF